MFSLGHLAIDVLAKRLGTHLSSERSGWTASMSVDLGPDLVTLTLFKPSSSRPLLIFCHP